MSTKQQTHEDVVKKTSFFHKFSKHRLAMLGLVILILEIIVVFPCPLF